MAKLEMNGLFAAAAFDNPAFVHQAGRHEILVVCDGYEDVGLGSVQVAAPDGARQEMPGLSEVDMRLRVPLAKLGEVSSRLRIEAWMSPEVCQRGKDWRGQVLVKWTVAGARSVRLSVRSAGEKAYKLWTSGTAIGQAMTDEWGRDGMQVRVDADGQGVGEFALDATQCRTQP